MDRLSGGIKTLKNLLAFAGEPVDMLYDTYLAAEAAAALVGMPFTPGGMSREDRQEAARRLWDMVGAEWVVSGEPSYWAKYPRRSSPPGWPRLRYEILCEQGRRCQLCGAGPDERRLEVDHIIPVQIAPGRAADKSNLRVLCDLCNAGKGCRPHPQDTKNRAPERALPAKEPLPSSTDAPG